MPENLLYRCEDQIAVITLNRPERRNALDAETSAKMRAAFDRFEGDPTARVAVLAGNGPVFCAGMDLQSMLDGQVEEVLFGPGHFGGLASRQRSKPVIACVQGAALAGGFELMLACDLAVAAPGTVFGLPEARLGLVAGGGGALRLGQILPPALANEILLLGGRFDAQQAHRWGLINRVAEADPMAEAIELARQIVANAPCSITASLQLARLGGEADSEAWWPANDRHLRACLESADAAEGARAFLERRPPRWTGD